MSKKDDLVVSYEADSETYSLTQYLELCRDNPDMYASPAERLLKAIGDPVPYNTAENPRDGRIFLNRTILKYPAFKDFYGIETVIQKIAAFFKAAAQGLEERKQILYLVGPVASAKSSLVERIKELMHNEPFYYIEGSPVHDSPLSLLSKELLDEYNIPRRYYTGLYSPWLVKRVAEAKGSLRDFRVVKVYPSELKQIAIAKVEPGDDNNQDVSTLIGKTDIRKLATFKQNDPDSYNYSGGLQLANRGILDFVEMFKAPKNLLNPLITATQERNYTGTEAIGMIPWEGVIVAHSNETEWGHFKNNKVNEAYIDRIYTVEVPYNVRITEEVDIYKKLLNESSLGKAALAPYTLDILAKYSVASRLEPPKGHAIMTKVLVYDGQDVLNTHPHAKDIKEYRDSALRTTEGFTGVSMRAAFKIISQTFNSDVLEVGADPVLLFRQLHHAIIAEKYDEETATRYKSFVQVLEGEYLDQIHKDIQAAYLDSYNEYGQILFDKYVQYADIWLQSGTLVDPETGEKLDAEALDAWLKTIEKPAGVSNNKDFRQEVVMFAYRYKNDPSKGKGRHYPTWTSYTKLSEVITKKIFSNSDAQIPIITFDVKKSKDEEHKHNTFLNNMRKQGYTDTQIKRVVSMYQRVGTPK
jgi:serine protein kinase